MPINLTNRERRDAKVAIEGVKSQKEVVWLDKKQRQTVNIRLLKSDTKHDIEKIKNKKTSLDVFAKKLISDDPEIDIENFGKVLAETNRVYTVDGKIVFHVREEEIVKNPDGTEKERRERVIELQNTDTDIPLSWTGKFIPKKEAVRRFVFTGMKQIVHINGLTYDFLYKIAEELHKKKSLLLIGAGKNGNKPLIFQRGGKGFRGFLEGRIEDESYCLLLHLSNMELKDLPEDEKDNG